MKSNLENVNKTKKAPISIDSEWLQNAHYRKEHRNELNVTANKSLAILRAIREQNITKEELSQQAGIPLGTINRLVKGNRVLTNKDLDSVKKIEDFLAMKTNLEKPVTLKSALEKKKSVRGKKKTEDEENTLSQQEESLIVQDKKLEKKLSKQTRSRARIKKPVSLESFSTTPIDEQEQYAHEQERPHLNVPENIPVEHDFTEEFDNLGLREIIGTEGKSFDEITDSINELVARNEIFPINDNLHIHPNEVIMQNGNFDQYEDDIINYDIRNTTPKYIEQKPYRTTQEYNRLVGKSSPKDNLLTFSEEKHARNNRGRSFLSKIKNFFSGVQEEADELMEKFGWNEPKK